jgi:predicted DCC family thiol-disulfide oxidoreductase YuxK
MSGSAISNNWRIEVFYDGDCPLCVREIKLLRWMDRKQRICYTDIAAGSFNPADYGKTMKEFMDEIHGRLPDGSWIVGVEVFRRIYAAIGLGPLVWMTRAPGISHGLELSYRMFAKNRLRLTGRCATEACQTN